MANQSSGIHVTEKHFSFIENVIDKSNIFGLKNGQTTRSNLFLFAMAFGFNGSTEFPPELSKKREFVKPVNIDKNVEQLIKCLALYIILDQKKNIETIADSNYVYDIASRYAMLGFDKLMYLFETTDIDTLKAIIYDGVIETYNFLVEDFPELNLEKLSD